MNRTSPFLCDHYDAALIPCTSAKNPGGMTAATLYKGGPFATMIRHAQQRGAEVFIMSAKYGLLRLDDPVRYYDVYIGDLTADQRKALIYRLRSLPMVDLYTGKRICSYLPKAYWEVFAEAKPALAATIRRPYKGLPLLPLIKTLSNEIKNYGHSPGRR